MGRRPTRAAPYHPMKRITIRIPDALLTALAERADDEHRDLSSMVRRILSLELRVFGTEDLDAKLNPELPLS